MSDASNCSKWIKTSDTSRLIDMRLALKTPTPRLFVLEFMNGKITIVGFSSAYFADYSCHESHALLLSYEYLRLPFWINR